MKRRLRALGLALIAAVAIAAVVASVAGATTLSTTTGFYPVTVTGSQEGEPTQFKVGAVRTVSCTEATLDGTLAAASPATTFTAAYDGCTSSPSALPVTVNMKSCDFTFTWGTPAWPLNTRGNATVAVDCATPADAIQVTAYKTVEHTTANTACTYAIAPQGPIPGAFQYHNIGAGTTAEVTLEKNLKEIKTKVITGTKLLCGGAAGETVNATLIDNAVLKVEIAATKEHVGIAVVH